MHNIINKINIRLKQLQYEIPYSISELNILITNLVLLNKIKNIKMYNFIIVVVSLREALTLKILIILGILPDYKIFVLKSSIEIDAIFNNKFYDDVHFIVTTKAFLKYYQMLSRIRIEKKLLVF